jgi:hypothetical protein
MAKSKDWDRVEDAIVDLYVHQRLPLSKVQEILERDHGFKAS